MLSRGIPRILISSLALLALFASTAPAAECDIPLMVQQGTVKPNVLIILDNSGSMQEPIWHVEFDPNHIYSGDFDTNRTYYVYSDGWYDPRDFSSTFDIAEEAPLIAGADPGDKGRYVGNYLNWVYYHATNEQRLSLPQVTRFETGRSAIRAIMNQAAGLNYGLMVFDGSYGGRLVAEIGAGVGAIEDALDEIRADTWTPTGETLMDALAYFQDDDGPIEFKCQQNFIILVTDGIPTKDKNVPAWIGDQDGDGREPGSCATVYPLYSNTNDCTDYMDDVAYYMAHNDMRHDLEGEQNVSTYTVGFAMDHFLIEDTAYNGKGLYKVAWDLGQLVSELGTVIGDIVNRASAGAAVAVVSTETGTENHLYRGKFMPGLWRGYLEAYSLPYSENANPVWEAGDLLSSRNPDTRTIFTNLDRQASTMTDFSVASTTELMPLFNSSDPDYVANVIEFTRGHEIGGFRDRDGWLLGDLVHSTPVVVGAPSQFLLDERYQAFLQQRQNRQQVVYIGSNDGMLHAFRASTGEEMWSYVPGSLLPKLKTFADPNYCHSSFVDLSPLVFDVKPGTNYRTYLFGGMRTGGNAFFAIDVTNPVNPKFRWERKMSGLTTSFTQPAIVRTMPWKELAWVGSGPSVTGKAVAAVMKTNNGARLLQVDLSQISDTNMLGPAVAFDKDWDGYHDLVYQGDLAGNLWRFEIDNDNGVIYFGALFTGSRPITAKPAVTVDEHGDVWVYFGTGKYIESDDVTSTDDMRFYAVRDPGVWVTYGDSHLINQTSSITEMDSDDNGWYFDLNRDDGERVIEPAAIVQGVVYFTSFAPLTRECSAGGRSWLYRVDFASGSAIDEDDEEPTGGVDDRATDLGDGIASRPVINLADEEIIIQTSDARLNVEDLAIGPQTILVRSWRERFEGNTASSETQEPPVDGDQ